MPQKDIIKYKEYQKKYWDKKGNLNKKNNRIKLLQCIGDVVCIKCGFSDIRALQIDHINGGGSKDRSTGNYGLIGQVKLNPEKFQILCANCNWIKRSENNEATGRPKIVINNKLT